MATPAASSTKDSVPAVQVHTSVYIEQISHIDEKNQTFDIVCSLAFVWKGGNDRLHLNIVNAAPGLSILNETVRTLESGDRLQNIRLSGSLSSEMFFKRFPFDAQTLSLEIEDFDSRLSELEFVPADTVPAMDPRVSLSDWHVRRGALGTVAHEYRGMFMGRKVSHTFSRLRMTLGISRRSAYYYVYFFIPLGILVIVSFLPLCCQGSEMTLEGKNQVGLAAFLSIIALQFTLSDKLVKTGYLVFMDQVFVICYVFIFVTLVLIDLQYILETRGRPGDRIPRLIAKLLYIGCPCALLLVLAITTCRTFL